MSENCKFHKAPAISARIAMSKPSPRNNSENSRAPFSKVDIGGRDTHYSKNYEPLLEDFSRGGEQDSLTTEEWLNSEQAARYLKISVGSLRNMTSNGQIPHCKLGSRNRYRVKDLRELLLSKKRGVMYGN